MDNLKIIPLTLDHVNQDFLDSLSSLKPTGLSVNRAKYLFINNFNNEENVIPPFVAILDGRVVGTATLVLEYKFIHAGGVIGHLEDVAVHKDFRHLDIGSALIKHLVEYAKSYRCYKIILDCKPSTAPFYEQLGFRITEEVNMRLDLSTGE